MIKFARLKNLVVGELSVGELSVGELSVGELSVGELSVGELSVGKLLGWGLSWVIKLSGSTEEHTILKSDFKNLYFKTRAPSWR